MTEQTRNITEAIIAKNLDDKLTAIRKQRATDFIHKIDRHLKTLRTFHLFGSTSEEVLNHKTDPYFSMWFNDASNGDFHAMHSIIDHFEPLELITNLGHNYRTKFTSDTAQIILDFRPASKMVTSLYTIDDSFSIVKRDLTPEEFNEQGKSYLYSCILRIAGELLLYFHLSKISFLINCEELGIKSKEFDINPSQIEQFTDPQELQEFITTFENATNF